MYSGLTSSITSRELSGTGKLLILFMKSFVSLMYEVADDGQQNVRSRSYDS